MTRGSTSGKTPTPTEHEEQAALIEWWNMYSRWKSLDRRLLLAIPNGGARNAVTGARLKDEGVRAGVPDLFLAVPNGASHGLWIELKRVRGGRVSEAQKEMLSVLAGQGYDYSVCLGWEQARMAILDYLGDSHVDA